jgi:hypothetical protein
MMLKDAQSSGFGLQGKGSRKMPGKMPGEGDKKGTGETAGPKPPG